MIVCAAKPPGSLDLTYFFKSAVSNSSGEATAAAEATTASEEALVRWEMERELERTKESEEGLCEIWEENERDESEDVREDMEIAIAWS